MYFPRKITVNFLKLRMANAEATVNAISQSLLGNNRSRPCPCINIYYPIVITGWQSVRECELPKGTDKATVRISRYFG